MFANQRRTTELGRLVSAGGRLGSYHQFVRNVFSSALIATAIASTLLLTGCSKPTLDVSAPGTTLGQATPISVHVHASRGVKSITATIEQNGQRYPAWQMTE